MNTYRLQWLDRNRNIAKSRHVECASDQSAIMMAEREIGAFTSVEIWDGERPVCHFGNPAFRTENP